MKALMNTRIRFVLTILLGLWLFATVINLNKAYHIDDTVHLEIAQWILQNPLHPMSGKINWGQNADSIHLLNQPHLYFYLLAAWGFLFGFSEIAMHVFQSLFTFACILFIYLIARLIIPKHALFLTALLTLSPAFVVGQNLMVDVPLLFLWLAFYYLLIKPRVKSETQRFLLVGFIAGCACLVKYTSVPLVLVMLVSVVIKKKLNLIWTIGIPIGMLILWSCFNYLDYGSIHILGRSSPPFSLKSLLDMGLAWLVGLGSILPYSPFFFGNLWHTKKKLHLFIQIMLILILLSSALIFFGAYIGKLDDSITSKYLLSLFLGNGIAVALLLLHEFKRNFGEFFVEANYSILILYLWIFSGALFIIFFSPFMATRHILLVIVPITLLLAHFIVTHLSVFWSATAVLLSILLTLALGISDRTWANYYREKAALIKSELPNKANIYFTGHYGWQWYAKQNGMKQLEALNPQIQAGDYLVHADYILRQRLDKIPPNLHLEVVKEYTDPPNGLTFFKTARFYRNSFKKLPWTINWHPFDKIVVYQVQTIDGWLQSDE